MCSVWTNSSSARRKVKTGQTLYREGDRFQFLYAVRSGTFKSKLMLADGREQVNGFCMAGEIMGLDGVAYGTHASSAIALEDAEVCVIPYAHLTELAAGNAGLHQVIARMMSREILREHSLMTLLGSMNAEERLAAFLLNLVAPAESARLFGHRISPADVACRDWQLPWHDAGNREPHFFRLSAVASARSGQAPHSAC